MTLNVACCENCNKARPKRGEPNQLECHIDPPRSITLDIFPEKGFETREEAYRHYKFKGLSYWPPVEPSDWCDKHEYK